MNQQEREEHSTDKLFQELVGESIDKELKNIQSQERISHQQSSKNILQRENHIPNTHSNLDKSPRKVNVNSKIVNNVMKGESKIEYVPFEKKIVQYKTQKRIQKVPKKRIITDYREQKVYDEVPRQVIKQDYYAVEHIRHYIPKQVQEKQVVMVPKEIVHKKVQYVPVTRQVVHGKKQQNENPYAFVNPYQLRQNSYHHTSQTGYYQGGMEPTYANQFTGGSFGGGSNVNRSYGSYGSNIHGGNIANRGMGNRVGTSVYQQNQGGYTSSNYSRRVERKKIRKYSDLYESYVSDTYV